MKFLVAELNAMMKTRRPPQTASDRCLLIDQTALLVTAARQYLHLKPSVIGLTKLIIVT